MKAGPRGVPTKQMKTVTTILIMEKKHEEYYARYRGNIHQN